MKTDFGLYELDSEFSRIQLVTVHRWLEGAYWSPGVSYTNVVRAAENSSLVVGAYQGESQVGYLRVVSDRTSFAWLCDVFVDESHRGKGIAKAMVRFALEDPNHQGLRRWVLATKDAHVVYAACGFEPLKAPERWMLYGANPSN
jgi:GNAT superfamily N-acetyltransferase